MSVMSSCCGVSAGRHWSNRDSNSSENASGDNARLLSTVSRQIGGGS